MLNSSVIAIYTIPNELIIPSTRAFSIKQQAVITHPYPEKIIIKLCPTLRQSIAALPHFLHFNEMVLLGGTETAQNKGQIWIWITTAP